MEFIENPVFTRQVLELLTDEEYRRLQLDLWERPDHGDLIKGGGGIRKVRVAAKNKGKSGGVRVIYYCFTEHGHIYLLLAYPKNKKDDLTSEELALLSSLVQKELQRG
jgi:hypothetical protein